jgi:hypothetical protein
LKFLLAGGVVTVGFDISRAVCVLGFVIAISAVGMGTAAAGGNDQLFQRQPERLVIESAKRVSDGRKLQRDADTSFRRAEGGAVGEGATREAADQGGGGSMRARESSEESTSSAGTSADR